MRKGYARHYVATLEDEKATPIRFDVITNPMHQSKTITAIEAGLPGFEMCSFQPCMNHEDDGPVSA